MGDGYFGTAHVGLTRVLPNLPQYLGEGEQLDYVRLAGAMYLHSVTATLVAKYYSIGVEFGDNLTIGSVKRPGSAGRLDRGFATADRGLDSGVDSIKTSMRRPAWQIYWAGRAREQKPTPHERFEALQSYFYTHLMAEMLGQLAGHRQDRQCRRNLRPGQPRQRRCPRRRSRVTRRSRLHRVLRNGSRAGQGIGHHAGEGRAERELTGDLNTIGQYVRQVFNLTGKPRF